MIKTFAQCSGNHKLTVSTEFPLDQGWVLGYVEYQTGDARDSGISKGARDLEGGGGRKRICIEPWVDEAAFRPDVGHYCSLACAAADLERALVTRRYNGNASCEAIVPSASAAVPQRVHSAAAYADNAA